TYLGALAAECVGRGVELPELVHVPAAYGNAPVPTEAEFYRPLDRLDEAWRNRLIAGIVDPGSEERSLGALGHFERDARPAPAVAARCGMGDWSAGKADQAMRVAGAAARV